MVRYQVKFFNKFDIGSQNVTLPVLNMRLETRDTCDPHLVEDQGEGYCTYCVSLVPDFRYSSYVLNVDKKVKYYTKQQITRKLDGDLTVNDIIEKLYVSVLPGTQFEVTFKLVSQDGADVPVTVSFIVDDVGGVTHQVETQL